MTTLQNMSAEAKTPATAKTAGKSPSKTLNGVVVKAAMKDTATVLVQDYVKHEKYKKYFKTSKKYLVHDAGNTAKIGDRVTIMETRPISKRKFFKLSAIVSTSIASVDAK